LRLQAEIEAASRVEAQKTENAHEAAGRYCGDDQADRERERTVACVS